MDPYNWINDPFLRGLREREKSAMHERVNDWGLNTQSFWQRVDNWFNNFDTEDEKELALKIFNSIDYYNPDRFNHRINQLTGAVERHLQDLGRSREEVVLVTPEGEADSADRHAYDVVKEWRILRNQVVSIDEIPRRDFTDPIFVLFNDTHGSGNQFLREVWEKVKDFGEHSIYVLAVSIAEEALQNFRQNAPRVHVIPHIPVKSVRKTFTADECELIQSIGERVYPPHPMGYGGTGLNVAYYFQCPNNTIPLVWADGVNNTSRGTAYPWNPLFPYRAKPKARRSNRKSEDSQLSQAKKITSRQTDKSVGERKNVVSGEDVHTPRHSLHQKKQTSAPDAGAGTSYRYRISIIDFDRVLSEPRSLVESLNECQTYFNFSIDDSDAELLPQDSIISIGGEGYLEVTGLDDNFFHSLDKTPVDASICISKWPLAFEQDKEIVYNYFSGPSPIDSRFLFISTDHIEEFSRRAEITYNQGVSYLVASQLAVYFSVLGYHEETRGCPMDFCEEREDMVFGLVSRSFCGACRRSIGDKDLLESLDSIIFR